MENDNKGLVSIIIPVYNAGKYIEKCIDSIIKQTYSNWELLLVNDGSKDNSLEVCNKIKEKDKRINVIDKINGGASSARNVGLKYCKGQFICFVDSDDYVGSRYIEDLVSPYEQGSNSMVICGMTIMYNNIKSYFRYDNETIETDIFTNLSNTHFFRHGGPTSKLYLKEIIDKNNLKFDEKLCNYEDLMFNLAYIEYINKIIFSPSTEYVYIRDNSTQSLRLNGIDSEMYLVNSYKRILDKHKNENIQIMRDYLNCFIIRAIQCLYLSPSLQKYETKKTLNTLSNITSTKFSYKESLFGKMICTALKRKQYFILNLLMHIYKIMKK